MFNSEDYSFLSSLVLRAPFYSPDIYSAELLPKILGEQIFRNALLLASPDLYRAIAKKGFCFNELTDKERLTLFKYYNRMSFRPTPFGAFASVSAVDWSADSQIRLGSPVLHLLPSLEAKIHERAGTTGGQTMLIANPTLYKFGQTWRYVRSQTNPSGKLEFSLQAIAAAPLHDHLFDLVRSKAKNGADLVAGIMEFTGCSAQDAAAYTAFLAGEQVLLADDIPGLIEPTSIGKLSMTTDEKVAQPLQPGPAENTGKRSFAPYYTGMSREPQSGGVDPKVQDQLRAVLDMLARIVPQGRLRALEDFKDAFKSRFDREKVPLLIALDPDAGISYGNLHTKATEDLLLGGLQFSGEDQAEASLEWTAVNRLFLRIWLQDQRRSLHDPVDIRDEDLNTLPAKNIEGSLPPSLAVLFTRADGRLIMENVGGATATALVGRFSVFDEKICLLAREISAAEAAANPDVLFAEIHQRSNNHVDNINRRVQLYDHIIPLNVFTHAHETGHILPGDLLVSVRGEQVILESLSLGRRVIPRLPTAYNFQHNELAIFRFLCELQYQGLQPDLTFDPERLFPGLSFYPRFSYRNCIISLAKWHFSKEQVSHLLSKPFSLGRLHLFRQDHGLPRHISLTQGDQQLVFDLANDREALFFLEIIRELENILIREYLFPDRALTAGKNLRHAGQYIALLQKKQPVYPGLQPELLVGATTERRFMPGGEWLNISLYCTTRSADQVLLNVLSPVLDDGPTNKHPWFFIRYHDPRPHLRIRVKTTPEGNGPLLAALKEQLSLGKRHDLVSDFKTETYCRELERYSPEMISRVEELFCAGTAVYLDMLTDRELIKEKEFFPFAIVYAMINHFLRPGPAVANYLHWVKEHFLKELKAEKPLKRDLDHKYREISKELKRTLDKNAEQLMKEGSLPSFLAEVERLSRATESWTTAKREEFLSDLIHMQVNRMFTASQRQNEAVIYYCLHKYERSKIAKEKTANTATAGN
jgi:thiopeptide-type bacteriocin biosynthesis protein